MAEAISIARPYAIAVFDEANQLSDLKGWSALLSTAADAVINPEVNVLITSPRVTKDQLVNLMQAICGDKLGLQELNFFKLLVENQRLGLLPEIAAMYENMRAEAEKNVDINVISAFELDEAQKQKIAAAMKRRMGREVRLSCKTDHELLGGIIIRAGDKVIDGSARTRLSELANALA